MSQAFCHADLIFKCLVDQSDCLVRTTCCIIKCNMQCSHILLSSDALLKYFTQWHSIRCSCPSTSAQQSDTASGLKSDWTSLLTDKVRWELVHRGPVQIKKQLHISQKQRWESVNMTFVTESWLERTGKMQATCWRLFPRAPNYSGPALAATVCAEWFFLLTTNLTRGPAGGHTRHIDCGASQKLQQKKYLK